MIQIRYRKKIDWERTLKNYESRLLQCRKAFFEELHGRFISDYVTKTERFTDNMIANDDKFSCRLSHFSILMKVAKHHGIFIQGFVPANKTVSATKHRIITTLNNDDNGLVVYIGKANPLTGIKQDSKYAIRQEDFVYMKHPQTNEKKSE